VTDLGAEPQAEAQEQILRRAGSLFHEILAALSTKRLLDRTQHKMPQPMYDGLVKNLKDPEVLERLAADGFELCTRALAAMGATDVSIHECGAADIEEGAW
jgi:hypothetical protein